MRLIFILLCICALTACASETDNPAEVVERYLQAKVEGDRDTLRETLCLEMEASLEMEAQSFASVTDVTIEGLECSRIGDTDAVQCSGEIVAVYGTEDTSFPLTTYRVVQEDGEWKWCGETG